MLNSRTMSLISFLSITALLFLGVVALFLRSCSLLTESGVDPGNADPTIAASTLLEEGLNGADKDSLVPPEEGKEKGEGRDDAPPLSSAEADAHLPMVASASTPTPTPDTAYRASIAELVEGPGGDVLVKCIFTHAHGRSFELLVKSESSLVEQARHPLSPINGQVEQRAVNLGSSSNLEDLLLVLVETDQGEVDRWTPVKRMEP